MLVPILKSEVSSNGAGAQCVTNQCGAERDSRRVTDRGARRSVGFLAMMMAALLIGPGIVQASMEIQELDGNIVRLDERVGGGKWLLVMLWATDCHICKQQKPEISRFHDKHKDTVAEVLGIALDGMGAVDKIKSYLDDHNPSFPNYVGDIAIVASHYLVLTEESLRGTPTYLLFNPDGELVGNNPGPLSVESLEQFIAKKAAG